MAIEMGEPLDPARYLAGHTDVQLELLSDALASGDRAYVAHAIGTIARARGGIAKLSAETGLQRQALHKALSPNGNPRLDTLLKVLGALGLRARVEEAQTAEAA